jgi:serine/threonine protein kinase
MLHAGQAIALDAEKTTKAMLVREWAGLGSVGDAIQRGWLVMPDKSTNRKLVLALAKEIAQGMAYLHEEGIINACLDCDRSAPSESRTQYTPL